MNLHHLAEILPSIDLHDFAHRGLFLAQKMEGTDLMSNAQVTWNDFLHSGKAGALAVGVVFGYMIRGITA
jgi:hypothetical protein